MGQKRFPICEKDVFTRPVKKNSISIEVKTRCAWGMSESSSQNFPCQVTILLKYVLFAKMISLECAILSCIMVLNACNILTWCNVSSSFGYCVTVCEHQQIYSCKKWTFASTSECSLMCWKTFKHILIKYICIDHYTTVLPVRHVLLHCAHI